MQSWDKGLLGSRYPGRGPYAMEVELPVRCGNRVGQLALCVASVWLHVLVSVMAADEPIRLIAHRGGVVNESNIENSLAALEGAVDRGYWMIEVDLRESKDGRVVAHHDADFQRFYDDPRKVGDMTWDEIQNLRSETGEYRPLLFDELASACRGRMRLMLDIKGPSHPTTYYQTIESILRDHGHLPSTLIIGIPQAKRYFTGRVRVSVQQDGLRLAIAQHEDVAKLYFLFERGSQLDAETIHLARQAGVPIVAGINTFHYATGQHLERGRAEIVRLRRLGVRIFQIDSVYDSILRGAKELQ